MDPNYGLKISANGVDVKHASNSQLVLSTRYPFLKLDSQNPASFQNISIFFTNEPPIPAANGTGIKTLIYSFTHGYTYVPAVWTFWQENNGNLKPFGDETNPVNNFIGGGTPVQHIFNTTIDTAKVNFYITQYNVGGLNSGDFKASTLKIRCYVFANDLTIAGT